MCLEEIKKIRRSKSPDVFQFLQIALTLQFSNNLPGYACWNDILFAASGDRIILKCSLHHTLGNGTNFLQPSLPRSLPPGRSYFFSIPTFNSFPLGRWVTSLSAPSTPGDLSLRLRRSLPLLFQFPHTFFPTYRTHCVQPYTSAAAASVSH